MKGYLPLLLIFAVSLNLSGQDFFREDFNQKKNYIILTNPTIRNLQTINYLVENKLLELNTRKTKFVGVYFDEQKYDFSQSVAFDSVNRAGIYFHEVRGDLEINDLYTKNSCTGDFKKIFTHSSGIFFFGGADNPPEVYGEQNTRSVVTDPQRHYFETTFLFHLLGSNRNKKFQPYLENKPNYFITGFCLGLQTMNVATGGTLIQDIPAELFGAETPEAAVKIGRPNLHRNYWQKITDDRQLMSISFHPLRFTEHPFFSERAGINVKSKPLVYSSHHQAIKKLGEGFEPTAVSVDGRIIEAIAHKKYTNVFAVQFHPEVPALYENRDKRKFHPSDELKSYHEIIGDEGLSFHIKYWNFMSKAIKKAVNENR